MPMLEIFLAVAPEAIAAVEGTAAIATAAETAAAAQAAATAAAAAEAAQAAQAAQAASGIMQAAPAAETAALQANQVAALGQETAALQANPELMQSVAKFNPPTSMVGPDSTQLANAMQPADYFKNVPLNGGLTESEVINKQILDTPLKNLEQVQYKPLSTPNQVGNYPGGSTASTSPNFDQFSTPSQIGNYPGGSTSPTVLDSNTFPTPNQAGFQPGGSTEPTVSNFRNANEIRADGENSFMKGFNAVSDWADKNPFKAAGLGYMAYSALNKPEPYKPTPYDGPLSKFRISPDFQGRQANPQDFQYTPRQYASGGITDIQSYAKGKLTEDNVDVGIYRDTDPDTANLDPLTAAMLRQSKLDKRSYVNTKAKFNKPTPMGTLNFNPVIGAAQGGIMGASNLGGYAAGGNPRLLRGPGDGMSDNIPATINNRQPARLADGEFVVPADVVSHLGNGSTEAGAKKLHEMMNNVRKARTGNQKQGKQINPNRFMPK